jgi:hypothetical protein
MPLEIVVPAFVVIAFVAIVWRFLPRSADGSVRLPAVIDESIGMWLIRRTVRRPIRPSRPVEEIAIAEPDADEIAYRIGVPGAPPPTLPTRFVVAQASSNAEPSLAEPPVTLTTATTSPGHAVRGGSAPRRPGRRPSGALAAQRRWAGAVALAVVAIALTTLALGARQFDGEVLSVTGTPGAPGAPAAGAFVSGQPTGGPPSRSVEPSSSPSP